MGAEVFVGILEIDVLGDRDAVLGDLGGTPTLVEDGIAAARAEGALHGAGELRDAGEQRLAGFIVEHHLLGHGSLLLWNDCGNGLGVRLGSARAPNWQQRQRTSPGKATRVPSVVANRKKSAGSRGTGGFAALQAPVSPPGPGRCCRFGSEID